MHLAVVLFVTLSQLLGIDPDPKPLFCADRTSFTLRISDTSTGCSSSERSMGANPVTKPRTQPIGLHPKVKLRFEAAKRAAAADGVSLYIASGFRTLERQQYLFNRAIIKYGSESAAARWVLPPDLSRHPMGLAMDINYPGDPAGAQWLESNGWKFGLCRVFENEWWHFEATTAPGTRCPELVEDPRQLLQDQ
jgi:zinc D-Ala-D-Ala carboxypeptidase